MYEVYLRPGAQLEVQVVAHLPGVESTRPPRRVRLVLIGDLAVAGIGLALAAVGASAWWWVPVTMLAPACRLVMIRDNKMRAVRANRLGRQLFKAVAAYEPEFAIYTSWPFDASHRSRCGCRTCSERPDGASSSPATQSRPLRWPSWWTCQSSRPAASPTSTVWCHRR
jgi:hypothetical protein